MKKNSRAREAWLAIKWWAIGRKNAVRHHWQRWRRGYSVNDLWDAGPTAIAEMAPRIIAFCSQEILGHPGDLTPEQWDEILRKIKRAFELYLDGEGFSKRTTHDDRWSEETERNQEEINEGLRLFGAWCRAMWN